MTEYIEREAAVNTISEIVPSMSMPDGSGEDDFLVLTAQEMCAGCIEEIRKIPAADVIPVVHGKWIRKGYVCGENEWECSNCGETEWRTSSSRMKYCMFCGARMDGE